MFKRLKNWFTGLLLAILAALGAGVAISDDASLTVTAPSRNTDNSVLDNLAGLNFYRGPLGGPYELIGSVPETVAGATVTYLDSNLPDGTYCYVATAYNNQAPADESDYSNEVCKTIDTRVPRAPANLVVN